MPMEEDQCDPAELARLAHLNLDDAEQPLLAGQLRRMIESFNRISTLPTDGVEPFAHHADPRSAVRPDEPSPRRHEVKRYTVPRLPGMRQGDTR